MQRLEGKQRWITTKSNTYSVPFSEDVRHFMSESRKNQTFFANLEGYYHRRILSNDDKVTLQDFVYCTLYYNQNNERSTKQNKHINNIAGYMISLSKVKNEVHFSSIWVYCYEYSSKTIRPIPVFKVYKTAHGREAFYIDENLNVYHNWDHYIDKAKFPSTFLCVPRYGEYNVVDDMINVEYISKNESTSLLQCTNFTPYSLKTVFPWVAKLTISRSVCDGLVLSLRSALKTAWDQLKSVQASTIIFLLNAFIRLYRNGFTEPAFREILQDFYMLKNRKESSSCFQDVFKNFSSKSLDQGFDIFEANKSLEIADNSKEVSLNHVNLKVKLSQSFQKFVKLWVDSSDRILPQLMLSFPDNVYLFSLSVFSGLLKCFQYLNHNEINHREQTNILLAAPSTSKIVSGGHASNETVGKLESNAETVWAAIEKLTLNLREINEAPFENVLDKFYRESENEILKPSMEKQVLQHNPIYTLFSNDRSEDFFVHFHSASKLNKGLKHLLKNKFDLRSSGPDKYEVYCSGVVVGCLFRLNEDSYIGYFSGEKKQLCQAGTN